MGKNKNKMKRKTWMGEGRGFFTLRRKWAGFEWSGRKCGVDLKGMKISETNRFILFMTRHVSQQRERACPGFSNFVTRLDKRLIIPY